MDLLLLAGVSITGLVLVLALVWVVPMLTIAAIAAAAEDA